MLDGNTRDSFIHRLGHLQIVFHPVALGLESLVNITYDQLGVCFYEQSSRP